jgi:hypothetical protein
VAVLTPEVAARWRSFDPRRPLAPWLGVVAWVAVILAVNEAPRALAREGDLLGAVVASMLTCAAFGMFVAPRAAALCAVAGAAYAVLDGGSSAVSAVTVAVSAYLVAVAVHGLRRQAARRAYVASVAERVLLPPDPELARRYRLTLAATVFVCVAGVAASFWAMSVVARERRREAAAPVVAATVVRHEDGDVVVLRYRDVESRGEVMDPAEYPVGELVVVYDLGDELRPVGEPYDASYPSVVPVFLCGVAALLAERTLTLLAARRRRDVPALEATAYPDGAVLLAAVPEGEEVLYVHAGELADERVLTAAGDLVPGGWVALLDGGEVLGSGRAFAAGRSRDSLREALWRQHL